MKCHLGTHAIFWRERSARVLDLDAGPAPCVVKLWITTKLEIDLASDDRDSPNDLVGLCAVQADRHEVRQLGYALFRQKAGQQNIGVWQVELFYLAMVSPFRLNLKTPALLDIEQVRENCG